MERQLLAIFSTDVQGYSRLMGDDEAATVRTLTAYREVLTSLIEQHRGRVIDSPGDNLLAAFVSVVDAVQCAVAIQRELAIRNETLPEHRRMRFRIGINLGDVIVEDGRLYGDGVNIAARLEALAEADGICVSGSAYEQVKNKLALGYVDLGEHSVKNITEPVRVYRVHEDPNATPLTSHTSSGRRFMPPSWRRPALIVGLLVILGILVIGITQYMSSPFNPTVPRLSIAVLPFTNLSGDPEQDYFSDSITEDLITDLSRISGVFVIARNTSFTYRSEAVNVQQVAKELGVRYVLEGSVRRTEKQVRVNAQLIDATSGGHVWSERFDLKLADVFALQNEITGRIARALNLELVEAESRRSQRGPVTNLDAMDYAMRGWAELFNKPQTRQTNAVAKRYLEQAIALDPQLAEAWTGMTYMHTRAGVFRWSDSRQESMQRAVEAGEKAVTLDPKSADAHYVLGFALRTTNQVERSLAVMEKCIALNRNYAPAYHGVALALIYLARLEESLPWIEQAFRLSPRDPLAAIWHWTRAYAQHLLSEDEAAKVSLKQAIAANPKFPSSYYLLASVAAWLSQEAEAQEALTKWVASTPQYNTVTKMRERQLSFSDHAAYVIQLERLFIGLRKAGMPE